MNKEQKGADKIISEDGMSDLWNVWYSELHNGKSGLTLRINRVIESLESDFQRIDVIENDDFGKLLVLYGSLMAAENDNNAYNEMIAHVPLFAHPAPEEVLIIGGGDCGALTEVLKHPGVKRCTMCEIDQKVVETTQKHLPYLTKGLEDPRANLLFADGEKFIKETNEKFDIVMLDLSDPIGPATNLFQKEFHQLVHNCLTEQGVMVAQTESPFYNKDTVRAMYANLKQIFPLVRMYTCFMPIYPSSYWSFAFCSKGLDPVIDMNDRRWDEKAFNTRYYNPEVHRGAFALPQFVRELVG